jgi:hypothetical protein
MFLSTALNVALENEAKLKTETTNFKPRSSVQGFYGIFETNVQALHRFHPISLQQAFGV